MNQIVLTESIHKGFDFSNKRKILKTIYKDGIFQVHSYWVKEKETDSTHIDVDLKNNINYHYSYTDGSIVRVTKFVLPKSVTVKFNWIKGSENGPGIDFPSFVKRYSHLIDYVVYKLKDEDKSSNTLILQNFETNKSYLRKENGDSIELSKDMFDNIRKYPVKIQINQERQKLDTLEEEATKDLLSQENF